VIAPCPNRSLTTLAGSFARNSQPARSGRDCESAKVLDEAAHDISRRHSAFFSDEANPSDRLYELRTEPVQALDLDTA
jgi:hypothetical protein